MLYIFLEFLALANDWHFWPFLRGGFLAVCDLADGGCLGKSPLVGDRSPLAFVANTLMYWLTAGSLLAASQLFAASPWASFLVSSGAGSLLLFWAALAITLTALFITLVLIRVTVPRFKIETLSKLGWLGLMSWVFGLVALYLTTILL